MPTRDVARVPLTDEDIALLVDALDSHEYWQLSDPSWRHSGAVILPSDDPRRWADRPDLTPDERVVIDEIDEPPIGQLIFDPMGEYANPNTQDGTEIAAIGERHVRIFQFGAPPGAAHLRPLGINFYDPAQLTAAVGMIGAQLRNETTSGYVSDFQSVNFEDEPGNFGHNVRAARARLLLYACMARAGFAMPDLRPGTNFPYSVDVSISVNLRRALVEHNHALDGLQSVGRSGQHRVPGPLIVRLVDAVITLAEAGNQDARDFCDDTRWQYTQPIFTGFSSNNQPVRGYRNLTTALRFHDPSVNRDPAEDIYDELVAGRIVIVDLHLGVQEVVNMLSESIVSHLLRRQLETFTDGQQPPAIQLLLEEAHNLFATERYNAKDADIWVKLAKEAAKLNLGMTYATQEVSGVAHQVKANTANWVVAHLNNTQEVRELSKFYDFEAYADAIIASEDRGYVRLKARSSPYIVPVQIDRYDYELVNEARAAAGDPPLTPNGEPSTPAPPAPASAVPAPTIASPAPARPMPTMPQPTMPKPPA